MLSVIEQSVRLLQDPTKGRAIRQEALKWVVHLVADLHQPLHAIADDRGGNDVIVQFNNAGRCNAGPWF
ncbi:MAG TPA: S1/P1 nuclease [Candidatus Methylomirabilis sp.]|nr:S1/P1 nuclease [Candidatus Methylomirabilis sp.]